METVQGSKIGNNAKFGVFSRYFQLYFQFGEFQYGFTFGALNLAKSGHYNLAATTHKIDN
ncbi:hypothetical protein [Caballeronia sp. SBC1]|uniref:hypothetical protein n=1 Tax=Caballeronia sp. SBC1 TaxID=2705548 RepID=UPI0013EB45B2|nr:hypothetical protein [Caballeronia sp. SBC1]